MWGASHIISPLSERLGGRIPCVPHLIARMLTIRGISLPRTFSCIVNNTTASRSPLHLKIAEISKIKS